MPLEVPPGLEGHDWSWPGNYMGYRRDGAAWSSSSVAILPIPYEATTSWGTGARDGPAAAISASRYIEKYDEELGCEPYSAGICTLPDIQLGPMDLKWPSTPSAGFTMTFWKLREPA